MNIKQYVILSEFDEMEDEEFEFPQNASQAFWEYALYHAKMIVPGYGLGMNGSPGSPTSMFLSHLEEALDDYLKLNEPVEWLYWLFKHCGTYTVDEDNFNLFAYGRPTDLANCEFVVQKSDEFQNMFEVYCIEENRVIHLEETLELANEWLEGQFALVNEVNDAD
jgi:hypothetical protein